MSAVAMRYCLWTYRIKRQDFVHGASGNDHLIEKRDTASNKACIATLQA